MDGVDLKDQLLHSYLTEKKQINKWYMKLFQRLLNTSILNAMIIHRNRMGKRTDWQLFRIQLAEGLFVKYANLLNIEVPSQYSSDNTVQQLTKAFYKQASIF
jgi:hypothetical protein